MKIGILNCACVREKALVDATFERLDVGDLSRATALEESDAIIMVTCGGLSKSINEAMKNVAFFNQYTQIHDLKVYVVGCLVRNQSQLFERYMNNPRLKFIKEKEWFVEVANDINKSNKTLTVDDRIKSRTLSIDSNDTAIQYVLEDGCNNHCTFCKYQYMDHTVSSIPYEEALNYFRHKIRTGTKLIHLIGTNLTQYGVDLYNEQVIHRLIHEISREDGLEVIFVDELVTKDMYDELLFELVNNPKVKDTRFQLETASDRLLKLMNRGYTLEEYDYYVKKILDAGKSINTILMTGFPTETMEDVKMTLDYVDKRGIYTRGISEYCDFSYLPSSKLEQLPDEEKKKHTEFLKSGTKKVNDNILRGNINKKIQLVYSGKTECNHKFYTPIENIFAISDSEKYDNLIPGNVITGTPKKLVKANKETSKKSYRI